MSTHFHDAFFSSPSPVNGEDIFDFDAASSNPSSNTYPSPRQATVEDAAFSDVSSDNDDGLLHDDTSTFDPDSGGEEAEVEEENTTSHQAHSWKIDHSSGDHKLRRKLRIDSEPV